MITFINEVTILDSMGMVVAYVSRMKKETISLVPEGPIRIFITGYRDIDAPSIKSKENAVNVEG